MYTSPAGAINLIITLGIYIGVIDYRRIGPERHVILQPIFKDTGHQRALRIDRCLAFHQRRDRHHLVEIASQVQLRGNRAKSPHHCADNLLRLYIACKPIRVREKVALKAPRPGIDIGNQICVIHHRLEKILPAAEAVLLNAGCNIKNIRALRYGQSAGVDVSSGDARVHLDRRRRMIEAVFAGAKSAALKQAQQVECVLVLDHPGLLECSADRRS